MDGLSDLFSGEGVGKIENDGKVVLKDKTLQVVEKSVLGAVGSLQGQPKEKEERKTLLLIDGLDFLMAATGTQAGDVVDMVLEWRSVRPFPLPLSPIFNFTHH